MPMTSKISSKEQVTVPKYIRESLSLKHGDRVKFIEEGGRIYIAKVEQVIIEHPLKNNK